MKRWFEWFVAWIERIIRENHKKLDQS